MYNQSLSYDLKNLKTNVTKLRFEGLVDDKIDLPFWVIYDIENDKYYIYEREYEYKNDVDELTQ